MQLAIEITYLDGEAEVLTAQPIDFVMWERHTGRRMSDLGDGVGMEDLAYLAYSASRRSAGERPPFDVWLERLADLDEADEQPDDPTPTQPAVSDGSTSS